MKLRYSISLGLLVALTSGFISNRANAQANINNSEPIRVQSIPDAFNEAASTESKDIFSGATIRRQLDFIFGFDGAANPGSYPENEISRDAERLNRLYRELLDQQISSDPIIRVPDVANPYNTSIRANPALRGSAANTRVVGSEFVFDRSPLQLR